MATPVVKLMALPVEGKKDEKVVRWLKHYSSAQSILIVGDGDFSFSRALATAFGSGANLVATSLDSYGALICKHHQAESNVRELKKMGATVLHDVDVNNMKLHTCMKMKRFDRIVFNFPHAGFTGQETQLHVINSHKELVRVFFRNASNLLCPDGEVHVSHKTGQPYDRWDIEQLASEYSLVMFEKVGFAKGDYPGYNQKKGDGRKCNRSFPLRNGCTFKFRMARKESEDESAMYCLVAAMAKMSMARAHDNVTM
ncbi:heavy metal-associated isoprenylated plant protein 41-like [Triticum dicoccoides]|uniref:heavy metal-associated isoprenylated plant protein 41-like n=1 Tax=Triticum dicoccoides TaxID=85692 RepID=UPI00189001B9|nr:heavy metal-associated isoprenylated plant protein 41-like [Triticum dicoccoides]